MQSFDFNKTMALQDLNEDLIGAANPDDIKAHVKLTPIVAHPTEADSTHSEAHDQLAAVDRA